VLGVVLLLVVLYEFMPSSSTNASTATPAATAVNLPPASAANSGRPARRVSAAAPRGKERASQSLDPTLHLAQLALTEQIKYEGSGRNIFVAQADAVIPTPGSTGATDQPKDKIIQIQPQAPPPPIPLKFFGFASRPGETKKIFLSKAEDVFIAGEGEIVDRRYKVVRISANAVEIQDLVVSGPAQSIPLTQEKPQ
jgi:hypothetical protein